MESLTYSNFSYIQPLTNAEKQYLEQTLVSFLSLFYQLKKIKPSIFVLLITCFLIFNITVVDAALKQGDQGNEVSSLQQKLQQFGYFQGKITGYFGSQTEQAVKRFQVTKNLISDGIVGNSTFSALNNSSSSSNPNINPNVNTNIQGLKKGDQGNEVTALQQKLQQLGYFQGKITGYFGSQTEVSLKQFQRAKNLTADGVAGRNTLTILSNSSGNNFNPNSTSSFNNNSNQNNNSNTQGLKKGDQGNEVTALQQKLQQLGYFQGKITGYFGSQTEASLKQFQRAKNLTADGIAGRNTLGVLSGANLNNSSSTNNNHNNNTQSSNLKPSINLNSQQIKTVQEYLKKLGYYNGNLDGGYGTNTHNSLLQFQRNNNVNNNNRMIVENFQSYTSSFGSRYSSISHRNESHNGLDFAAPRGSYIRNWSTGTVTELSDSTACGTLIRIQSGNFEHVYCHLQGSIKTDSNGAYLNDPGSGLNIRKGQTISAGTRIGRVGMTGRTTGPHLHWALKYNGEFIDPFLVLLK